MDAEWLFADSFLHLHTKDTASPPEYEASVMLARDIEGRYIAVWCDTFGGEYARIGYGTRVGNSVHLRFEDDTGVIYNKITRNPETDSWTFRGEIATENGSRHLFIEDQIRRR